MSKRRLQPAAVCAAALARPRRGFTLIELLVVLAIAAILAAIAYPSYRAQVSKTRRADAQAVLSQAAQYMERIYTESGKYNPTGFALPSSYTKSPIDGTTSYYLITLPTQTATTFTLQAAANPAGPEKGQGSLQIDHSGARRWDKNAGGTFSADEEHW